MRCKFGRIDGWIFIRFDDETFIGIPAYVKDAASFAGTCEGNETGGESERKKLKD